MADKSPELILTALSQAVAYADGVALFSSKTSPGLFPATAAGKQAAQRCLDEGYLCSQPPSYTTEPPTGGRKAKAPVERFTLTDKGFAFLFEQVSPRLVLEDLVRILEQRQTEVADLVRSTRQMQQSLEALRGSTEKVLRTLQSIDGSAPGTLGALFRAFRQEQPTQPKTPTPPPAPAPTPTRPAVDDTTLEQTIRALLARWQTTSGASEDCPLPELFRQAQALLPKLPLGQFQDALRRLNDGATIYLHPWTGPLYDLPEPPQALLAGHEIAYYASLRTEAIVGRAS